MSSSTRCICAQPTGTIGNEVQGSLFGPHFRHIHLSIFKGFPVAEQVMLQFCAESFNISDTRSFIVSPESGTTQLGKTSFGMIQDFDTNYTPRHYQFALKAQF